MGGKVDAGKKVGKVTRRKTKMTDASSPTVSQSYRKMSSVSGADTAAVEANETRKRTTAKSIHSHQVQAGISALKSPVQPPTLQKNVSVTTSRGGTKTSEVRLGRGANTKRNVNG